MTAAPEIARYRKEVEKADPQALWDLGCDARHFSQTHHPGETLIQAAQATYFYNPENCPASSLDWLAASTLPRFLLDGASHWPSLDSPVLLARAMHQALDMPDGQT